MKSWFDQIDNLKKSFMGWNPEPALNKSSDPSQYKTPKSFSQEELFNAIRQDVMAELDAINLYEAHKAATNDEELKAILDHIIAEEKDHISLLQNYLKKHGQWAGKHGSNYKS